MNPFLWGASTAAHQVEGNNLNSDWWKLEALAKGFFEPSGDAVDSYHRFREDMQLLADAGLNSYRFSIEWARIEPRPGEFSKAELAHYRRMVDTAFELGLTPVVTLHHFTHPQWFIDEGGWRSDTAFDSFDRYVRATTGILGGVEWVATINEPNVLNMMSGMNAAISSGLMEAMQSAGTIPARLPLPDATLGHRLAEAHGRARDILHAETDSKVGWTVAGQALTPISGFEEQFETAKYAWEDLYLQAARGDDFIGVQSYTSQPVDGAGIVPHPDRPDNTINGWAYRPDALGIAIRNAAEVTGGVPILVTENGMAVADDRRRIEYTSAALLGLLDAVRDGIDVRGYLHWSALDNYEWGHWGPTFGLIAVDRQTFERTPKPSLAWLGSVAAHSDEEQLRSFLNETAVHGTPAEPTAATTPAENDSDITTPNEKRDTMSKFNLDTTTLGTLFEDPEALAVIDEVAPGLSTNPMIGMAKTLPFNSFLGFAGSQLGEDLTAKLTERLEAL